MYIFSTYNGNCLTFETYDGISKPIWTNTVCKMYLHNISLCVIKKAQRQKHTFFFHSYAKYIGNLRQLSENIKFICTIFRNRQKIQSLASFSALICRECMYIVFILQCQKSTKQLPNYLKRAETNVVLIICLWCPLRRPCLYRNRFLSTAQIEPVRDEISVMYLRVQNKQAI